MIHAVVDRKRESPEAPAAAAVPGADSAAEQLIRRHWASTRRYLRVLGADAALADDLAQDTFVLALQKGIVDRGAATAAWLRRTGRFILLDHSRRLRPAQLDVAEEVWRDEDGDATTAERQGALRDCLPLLTSRGQAAVRLAYGERRSWREIGEALDMKVAGVKTLLRRCRATLADCIRRTLQLDPARTTEATDDR
ncbi:MAG: sigma-70 family RNA polymerase sigma factor [bacterium]|nr:sigma-70 family RNA polymerase sigma factor [bacterium]